MANVVETQSAIDAILSAGWIRHAQWFAEIDSTNSVARRYVENRELDALALPALFVAQRQTAGRGRLQREWWSPDGCLMLTVAITTHSLPDQPQKCGQLALVCGLAVANTIARFVDSPSVQLKWPNDVYAFGKKIAGILIESDGKVWSIGIGLNVHMNWSAAPVEIARKATCVSTASRREVSSMVVLVELIEELQHIIQAWRSDELDWVSTWHQRCLLTGQVVHARLPDQREIIGMCEGIDAAGRLVVRDESKVQLLTSGEILAWQ